MLNTTLLQSSHALTSIFACVIISLERSIQFPFTFFFLPIIFYLHLHHLYVRYRCFSRLRKSGICDFQLNSPCVLGHNYTITLWINPLLVTLIYGCKSKNLVLSTLKYEAWSHTCKWHEDFLHQNLPYLHHTSISVHPLACWRSTSDTLRWIQMGVCTTAPSLHFLI